jgi:hypothetical protein
MANQKISVMTKVPTLTGGMKIALGLQEAGIGNYATDPDQIASHVLSRSGTSEYDITATSKTLDATSRLYVFTGSSASTWTLPAPVANLDIEIKSRGSADITLNSNSGSQIYGGAAQASLIIGQGESYRLHCDGTFFNIL